MTTPALLPTSVVGSHGLPGWVWLAREAMEAGPPRRARRARADGGRHADRAARPGARRRGRAHAPARWGACASSSASTTGSPASARSTAPRQLGQPLWDTNTPFEVTEKIAAPQGLGIVEEFTLARALTDKPLKATVPGPYTLLVPLKLGGGYTRQGHAARRPRRPSSTRSAGAGGGGRRLHPDRRAAPRHVRGHASTTSRAGINRAVEGVDAKIAVHVCFGNLYGRPFSAVRDYRNLFPTLGDLKASQIVLEFANRGLDEAERWKRLARATWSWARASSTSRRSRRRRPRTWPSASARSCRYVPPDQLWLNPDCGFWETPRWVTRQKLAALVEGARLVRRRARRLTAPGYTISSMITLLTETGEHTLPTAQAQGDRLWLSPAELETSTGWSSRPEGLCRGSVCVPIPPGREREFVRGGQIDAAAVWRHLGQPLAHSDEWRRLGARGGRCGPGGGPALAGGAGLHAARSHRAPALALRASRQEGAARVVGLVVRVPPRPARVAGAV